MKKTNRNILAMFDSRAAFAYVRAASLKPARAVGANSPHNAAEIIMRNVGTLDVFEML